MVSRANSHFIFEIKWKLRTEGSVGWKWPPGKELETSASERMENDKRGHRVGNGTFQFNGSYQLKVQDNPKLKSIKSSIGWI